MRLVVIDGGADAPVLAVQRGDRVVAVRDLPGASAFAGARDVADVAGVPGAVATITAALEAAPADAGVPLVSARLLAPVLAPGKVIGVGLNYRSHAVEQGLAEKLPRQPILFAKWSDSVVGPDAVVAIPYAEATVDYECEVAVVIGREGRDIPAESALDHVFGMTAVNDLSDRRAQLAERQWTRAKSFDGFTPLGPAVVTLDEIPDIARLGVTTTLNGEVVQRGDTSDLIFDIPTLVAVASQGTTLRPGDVIATGTPSGVGFVKDPPVFLQPGDVVTVAVEFVGELTTTIGPVPGSTS